MLWMPPAEPQRTNNEIVKSRRSAVVNVPRVPLSEPLVRGLQDLHQNGGLQLFIDALTIYRRNEQRVQRDSKNRLRLDDAQSVHGGSR